MKHIWSGVFTFSVLALTLVVALELQRATFKTSLLARCGDIEPNPGPLGREGEIPPCHIRKNHDEYYDLLNIELEQVDDSHVLGEFKWYLLHTFKCLYMLITHINY